MMYIELLLYARHGHLYELISFSQQLCEVHIIINSLFCRWDNGAQRG